jgi:hypothetical protein
VSVLLNVGATHINGRTKQLPVGEMDDYREKMMMRRQMSKGKGK